MKLIPFLILATTVSAQTATLTLTGPASAKAGQTITLTLTGSGGVVAAQWGITYPAGYTATVAGGSAATSAVKTPTCTTDGSFCLLTGLNATVIAAGPVAILSLKIPAGATPGPVAFPLVNMLGATASGSAVTTTSGTPYSLTITDRRDINGDGSVTAADVQIITAEVVAAQTNPAACVDDQNGDGKCDLIDVMQVLLKVLGLIP